MCSMMFWCGRPLETVIEADKKLLRDCGRGGRKEAFLFSGVTVFPYLWLLILTGHDNPRRGGSNCRHAGTDTGEGKEYEERGRFDFVEVGCVGVAFLGGF